MKITLHTLSYLHVGTGEDLSALDYVIEGNTYFRVSQDVFFEFLQGQGDKRIELISAYSDWLINISEQIDEVQTEGTLNGRRLEGKDRNQTLSALKKSISLPNFFQKDRQQLKSKFIAFLRTHSEVKKYAINGNSKQQIRGLMTNGFHLPYLAGSSIKGAIRTALLHQTLSKYGNTYKRKIIDSLAKELEQRDSPQRLAKKIGHEVEYIAYCGEKKKKFGKEETNFQNVQLDVFKFLTVSDAIMQEKAEKAVEVVSTDLYLIGKEETNTRNSEIKAMKQPQAPAVEAIKADIRFTFDIHFRLQDLFAIYDKLPKDDVKRQNWIKIEEKVLHVFGIDLKAINKGNIATYQKQAEDYIWEALTNFAKKQIEFEDKWLKNYLTKPLSREIGLSMPEFKVPFEKIFGFPFQNNTLLRVGFATGFANSTEWLYFLSDKDFHRTLYNMMKKLSIGKPPHSKGGTIYEPDIDKFPKSRMMASPRNSVIPLGWTELMRNGATESEMNLVAAQKIAAIEPEFAPQRLKVGDIIDGVLISKNGKQKTFKLYLYNNQTQDASLSWFADMEVNRVFKLRIGAIDKQGKVLSFSYVGEKKD